jgi:hypothetical protein
MFNNSTEFSMHIESLVGQLRLSHMDAVLHYCAENYIEPEEIVSLISKSLKDKIENDMKASNLLPKTATLE